MADRVHDHPGLIFSDGTRVVALRAIVGPNGRTRHPRGAVGVVAGTVPGDVRAYRVRFADGGDQVLPANELAILAKSKEGDIGDHGISAGRADLFARVAYRCVIGSQAYGLAGDGSDVDRRGFYVAPADLQWSLYGVPDQIECDPTQEVYWELQKFLVLALKANPNMLECLYTPLVEATTPLADELLAMRSAFLSKLVYQTYNGYVASQFKKAQADLRNHGEVKWKHVMHLLRLLLSGIAVLREGVVQVHVGEHRDRLLAVRRGEVTWDETEAWRLQLHAEFDAAAETTTLPDRPDTERVNDFLVRARRSAAAAG